MIMILLNKPYTWSWWPGHTTLFQMQVTNKKAKYDLFCILKGLCKDIITQIQHAPEQEYLLPNSIVFLFTRCFTFWKQKVFKISFLDQCLSNAVIYNQRKKRPFFFSQNEMPGEHFILGIMMECCRYFYGAMMPDCNFQSQFNQEIWALWCIACTRVATK